MHLHSWRKIAISLIVPQKGEQTAQACAMAWFRHSSYSMLIHGLSKA
jgi:hypothetical protein